MVSLYRSNEKQTKTNFAIQNKTLNFQGENKMDNGPIDYKKGITTVCTNILFLLDASGSMSGERISQLNYAMQETLNVLVEEGLKSETEIFVRVIKFNSGLDWVIGDETKGVLVDDAVRMWKDLEAAGGTDTAGAIDESLKAFKTEYFGYKNKKPIVILVTDGESNDPQETKRSVDKLKTAMSGNTGKEKIVRIAVGVEDHNETELNYFASKGKIIDDAGERDNVPLVFGVSDATAIAKVIKNVAVSSLYSVGGAGAVALKDNDDASGNQDQAAELAIDDTPIVIENTSDTTETW